jgi:DNA topoisomerase-2
MSTIDAEMPKVKAIKKAAPAKEKGAAAPKKKKTEPLAPRKSNERAEQDEDAIMLDVESEQPSTSSTARATPVGGVAKTATQMYQKLSQLEHVLKRPDTYIGSVETRSEDLWVYDNVSKQMEYR